MKKRSCARISSSGQSVVEFALILPLLMLIVLGVAEFGFALLDEHVVTRLSREGSNLISRDTSLQDAATAVTSMSSPPVNFTNASKLIFSVVRKGATTGSANYDMLILYQRYEYGAFSGTSQVTTAGAGTFGGAPDYQAANSDTDTSLRVTNLPSNLVIKRGGMIYITEIFTRHTRITPLDRFGVMVPQTLYSIAYF
jgi:Flp pilus assembly protein TadG